MTYNNAAKTATNKYRAKFDIIQIRVEQGNRDAISNHAKKRGESMNAFINRAIMETIAHDNEKE